MLWFPTDEFPLHLTEPSGIVLVESQRTLLAKRDLNPPEASASPRHLLTIRPEAILYSMSSC